MHCPLPAVESSGEHLDVHDPTTASSPQPAAFVPATLPPFTEMPRCSSPRATATRSKHVVPLGIHSSIRFATGQRLCDLMRLARNSGASLLRESFQWDDIEPRRGEFHWLRWDAITAIAAHYGLQGPAGDRQLAGMGREDADRLSRRAADYAAIVAAIVRRYGPGGTLWRNHANLARYAPQTFELWNEPYQPKYSGGHPDPRPMSRLVKAAVQSGRAANPRARYLLEAETTYDSGTQTGLDWIAGMYGAVPDLNRWFDGIAVHPYGYFKPDYVNPSKNPRFQTTRVALIHRLFARHGAGTNGVWITEIGWPTCTVGSDPRCVTRSRQAAYAATFFRLVQQRWSSFVRAAVIFTLEDSPPGAEGASVELTFGLLGSDGHTKPAINAMRAAARGTR